MRTARRILAACGLLLLVAGVPLLLWWWAGPPQAVALWHALRHPAPGHWLFAHGLTDTALARALVTTSWIGWTYLAATVALDVVGRITGLAVPRLPFSRSVRWLVAAGLGSSLTLGPPPRSSTAQGVHPVPVHALVETTHRFGGPPTLAASLRPLRGVDPWHAGPSGDAPRSTPEATLGHGNPLLPVGYGLLGAAIVTTIDRMRRGQFRRRPEGRRIVLPIGSLGDLERDLRAVADHRSLAAVDHALALFETVAAPLQVEAAPVLVRVCETHVDLVFAEDPSRGPEGPEGDAFSRRTEPFVSSSDGRTWQVARTALPERAAPRLGSRSDFRPASRPGRPLVSLGTTSEGHVLIDLSQAGSTAIRGPRAHFLAEAMVLELAALPWARGVDIVLVGQDTGLAAVPRLRVVPSVDQALSPRPGSLAPHHLQVVVVDAATTSPRDVGRLLGEAAGGKAGAPAVVVIGDANAQWVATADHHHLEVLPGQGQRVVMDGRGPAVGAIGPVPCREGLLPDVAALLATSRALTFEAAPGPFPDSLSLPDPGPGTEPATGGTTEPCEPEVLVRILGPVEVIGHERAFQRAWALELVVLLSLRTRGVSTEEWSTALWPDRLPAPASVHSTASAARRALGTSKRTGTDHLPRGHGRLVLGPGVSTDWRVFQELAAGDDAEQWRRALSLVRGRPLDGLRQPDWAVLDGTVATIECLVVDVACRLAERCLDSGDPATAEWAARQALRAIPYDERLYRLLLRAADASGNSAGVEATMRELLRVLADDVAPFDTIHPETVALYRALSRRTQNRLGA